MKYTHKRLDDVDELVEDLFVTRIRFFYGQLQLADVNAFMNEIAAEVFHSQCRRRDVIHLCSDRLKCSSLSEKARQCLKTWMRRVRSAHERVTYAYEELQRDRDVRQANGYAEGYNQGYNQGESEGMKKAAQAYDVLMCTRDERMRKEREEMRKEYEEMRKEREAQERASASAAESGKYFIRIPAAGLPNGGKIEDPPLKRDVFLEFVYSQMDAVEKKWPQFKGDTIAGIMTDAGECEWAGWLKEASNFLRIGRSPASWAKAYRTWKRTKEDRAADRKGLSAGRVGKTAGVKQRKSSFAPAADALPCRVLPCPCLHSV